LIARSLRGHHQLSPQLSSFITPHKHHIINLKMSAPSPPSTDVNNQNNNDDNNPPVQYQFMEVPPAPGDNTTAHMVTQGISPAKTADQSPPSDPSPSDPSHDIASLLTAASSIEAEAATTAQSATADATTATTCGKSNLH
jgi:hypothetical protein